MAVCKDAVEFEVMRHKAAKMKLIFHCKPQRWSVAGQKPVRMDAPGTIRNPFSFASQPIIRVYGTGAGVLYVGDNAITIHSIDQYVDLNCETHNAYNAGGFCNQTILSEDFPELAPGSTRITWTEGISYVEVTPRWWTL